MPLSDLLGPGPPVAVTVGLSGASVERWGDRFLKTSPPTWDRGLDAEAARLEWLATTPMAAHAPTVVAYEPGPPLDRLLTTALAGVDLTRRIGHADGAALARRYGQLLRHWHDGLDPGTCPFDARIDVRLAAAERRVAEGEVDADDFEDEHLGRTPADVLADLVRTRPTEEDADLVVTHGDWCFPNVVVDPGGDGDGDGWGTCDLAGLGVGCRWYDLGIGARSTGHNVGPAGIPAFYEGYGVDPDHERARWYVLLDELQ